MSALDATLHIRVQTIARFGFGWYALLTEANAATRAEKASTLARLAAEQVERDFWAAFRGVGAALTGREVPTVDLSRLICPGCDACRPEAVAA